jgi:hypothetical protein
MSHFVESQTEFRNPKALIAGLIEYRFPESRIEVHKQAVPFTATRAKSRAEIPLL